MPVRYFAFIAVLFVTLPPIDQVGAREYQFASIDQIWMDLAAPGRAPLVDNFGRVTYVRDNAIARGSGGSDSIVEVVPSTAIFSSGDYGSIKAFDASSSGQVAVLTRTYPSNTQEVYRTRAGLVEKVASTNGFDVPSVAINDNSLTVFVDNGRDIYTSDDPTHPLIIPGFNSYLTVRVNNSDQIGFYGYELGVIDADGKLSLVNPPSGLMPAISYMFDFNDMGDMAFVGFIDGEGDNDHVGLFSSHESGFTLWADTTVFDADTTSSIGINNLGEVVVKGQVLGGENGIYFGGDPIHGKVIATGDSLAGSIVQEIVFGHGINDAGQIAFWAQLADGRAGVFRADPVDISLPGDANLDGVVDGADYTRWADHFLMTGQTWEAGDFTGDGIVDGADYTVWADHFAPAQLTLSAVPEPNSLALASIAGLASLIYAMRRRSR